MEITDKFDILYARSSNEDSKDSESIENQVALLTQYANAHGFINIRVITDDGYTGTNFNRSGFQEMLALIRHRRVARVIVKDLSRLGRNTIEVGHYIGVVFPRYGVEFISVHDGPESSDPDSLVTQFKNIMNEYYAKDISDKQKLSLQARSNSGRHIASSPAYGYKLDPADRHHWIIDKPSAEVVRLIFNMYNNGLQVAEIARQLSAKKYPAPSYYRNRVVRGSKTEYNPYHWTGSSVTAILKRQEYTGDTVNFKTYHTSFKDKQVHFRDEDEFVIIPDTQEPIITREEYEKAKQRRRSYKRVQKERKSHLLDNMIFCHECSKKMYLNFRNYAGGECYVYICDGYRKKKSCTSHYIQEDAVNSAVIESIQKLQGLYQEGNNICRRIISKSISTRNSEASMMAKARINEITERLNGIQSMEQSLFEQRLNNEISQETFNHITISMNKEASDLRDEYGRFLLLLDSFDDQKKGVAVFMTKLRAFADTPITTADRYIVEQLVDKVTVSESETADKGDRIKIFIHFADVGIIDFE